MARKSLSHLYASNFMGLCILGLVMFLLGFFPISTKHYTQETLPPRDITPALQLGDYRLRPAVPAYNQIILIVIDAFRFDFPTSNRMPFTESASCAKLKLRVNIPTVTMPRIKSLTTGTSSGFIDVILNLGHEDKLHESLLHDFQRNGYRIVFAGDRTWVSLFPNVFERAFPNMDSFFVNDFYEGDKNVTRVMLSELNQTDWHLLILHYLGLDHIGHVEGSASEKIHPKLQEMDDVVQRMVKANHLDRQLILLTGDHGMRNGGGHGGSTLEEIYVPLIFFNDNCMSLSAKDKNKTEHIEYNQIDLAATIAQLMALEVPRMSVGCLIPELLEVFNYTDQLYAHLSNTKHLINTAQQTFGMTYVSAQDYNAWFELAKQFHLQFLKLQNDHNETSLVLFEQTKREYIRTARKVSQLLSDSLVTFDYDYILMGFIVIVTITLNLLIRLISQSKRAQQKKQSEYVCQLIMSFVCGFIIYCALYFTECIERHQQIFKSGVIVLSLVAIVFTIFEIKIAICDLVSCHYHKLVYFTCFPISCYVFYILSLGSSSFIEYEEEIWYYLTTTNILFLVVALLYHKNVTTTKEKAMKSRIWNNLWNSRHSIIIALGSSSLLRIFAQQLYPFLCQGEQKTYTNILLVLGLLMLLRRLNNTIAATAHVQKILIGLVLSSIFCYQTLSNSWYITSILCFWSGIVSFIAFEFYNLIRYRIDRRNCALPAIQSLYVCSLLVCALLQKPSNNILIPVMLNILDECYYLIELTNVTTHSSAIIVWKTMITLFVGKMFFYGQGNSNSLATIDLTPGFIGQSTYNAPVAFILVSLNTYCAPNNAFFHLILHLMKEHHSLKKKKIEYVSLSMYIIATATLLSATVYMGFLILLRYHLFIYSVFAPKALYEGFNVLVFYCIFNLSSSILSME